MDNIELLFFDTFSHDISEELNLDLVQFPKPVYISEIRIIPLGARVQADFPGGVRLGATNPSQFEIEFFVNDLSKPGASTFESLGGLEYKQNIHIQLECDKRQIPTDGLVLRGWYTTITLAVYGSLTKSITNPPETVAPAPAPAPVPPPKATTPIPEEKPAPVVPPTPEGKADWYPENQTPAQATPQPEPCPAPVAVKSPTIPVQITTEVSQKTVVVAEASKPEAEWTKETTEEPQEKPVKPPCSPPLLESLVSLSPESISAEEEEGEREPEEATAEAIEPFEPILSDEEMMADDIPSNNMDYQYDIPEDLYAIEPPDLLNIDKLPDIVHKDSGKNETFDKTRDVIQSLAKSVVNFSNATGQEKETFVHNCETLCNALGSFVLAESEDIDNIAEIVNAGLDMDLARTQPQPAYKVRHVKVGVRLAEATSNLPDGADILLKFNAPKKLLTLCLHENVALPVKLAAIRALDAALISSKVVEEFLKQENNLYVLTAMMLDEAKLGRLKYALTSLLRKIHVYELLAETRSTGLNEKALEELSRVYICAPTLMAQPKRQLPARLQMEFEREHSRNPRKHLISYFEHHGLIRQLFYTLTALESSESLIKTTRKFLVHLSNTGEGLLYFLKEHEVTKVLLKALKYDQKGTGSNIAWKLQVVQCLMKLKYQKNPIDWLVIKKLHSFLTYPEGLQAIVTVLPMNSFVDILIPLLANRDVSEFAAEIIAAMVKYSDQVDVLQRCATSLLEESRNNVILKEVVPYLNVAVVKVNWNYSDVSGLVTIIRKSSEKVATLPGELITACRILYYLIFPSADGTDPIETYIELKHRNALTQLFAADGLTALVGVISNLTTFYEQPFLHRPAFTGRRGLTLLGLVYPCVKLIRALLECLVKCMGTEFKDLTPVVPLLGTYALVDAIPKTNHLNRLLADEIAETLLLFTKAVDSDGAGNVAKSLWTQMLGEILKMISASPCNFIPGLKLFSRILPPILNVDDSIDSEDVTRALGFRKLWSAHLQAQAGNLTETLRLLCASWNETLLTLLSTVCKQLSDLAAPTALLVGRCLLDRVLAATPLEKNGPILGLLRDLTLHPPVKATLLTLLNPTSRAQVKSDQKYLPVIDMMCTSLKNADVKVQIEILDIFHTLCDHKLSIVQDDSTEPFELRLTHSVPSKEPLFSILTSLIDILANANKYNITILKSSLDILLMLIEHNYGLYHVKSCLENNLGALKSFFDYVAELEKTEDERIELVTMTVTFLENLNSCSKSDKRSLYLKFPQLATIIMWEKNEPHPLEKIRGSQDLVNELKSTVEGKDEKESVPEMLEPLLPTPDALLNQFSQRSVKRSQQSPAKSKKRPFSDSGNNLDNCIVDLIALVAELLPNDFNLINEMQSLCSKVPKDDVIETIKTKKQENSDIKNIQKTPIVPPTKTKPFVAPMRGRGQFVTSRGGLTAVGVGRGGLDPFRSRPPNTSRPPSLHVDDFVALETCGAQPTGPTGYNKLSVRGTCPPRGVITGSRCRSWVAEPRPPYHR